MYKLNTDRVKLVSKVKEHFGKLVRNIRRLINEKLAEEEMSFPILLVNIPDQFLLEQIEAELKLSNKDFLSQKTRIVNINTIPIS
jgi:hypothetical protein